MQNNVTELTQRLLQSLDSEYNVINMPAVIEIISLLEKVAITKELLEATRLGKYVNELRKKTKNENLSRRAKELVKKWRSLVLPELNGQLKQHSPTGQDDQNKVNKKRPPRDSLENANVKRPKVNGQVSELDFSDNSNSSFKDVISYNKIKPEVKREAAANSDSNSTTLPEPKQEAPDVQQPLPKKRGRKKGSTNHKKLVDEAETSFTNKLAVSRSNSKVKTTQELVASLQNKNSNSAWALSTPSVSPNKKEDLNERAAKLTERVSIIDQKLYTNCNRYKNSHRRLQKPVVGDKNDKVIESGSVTNDKSLVSDDLNSRNSSLDADSVIILDDETSKPAEEEEVKTEEPEEKPPQSLSVEEALALLPPIDKSVLEEVDSEPVCTCILKEVKPDFSEESSEEPPSATKYEYVEDPDCHARAYLSDKYHCPVTEERLRDLHCRNISNVNGNYSLGTPKPEPPMADNGLYVNIVPDIHSEVLRRDFPSENYKKYSISESPGDVRDERTERNNNGEVFREWHEVIERPSYNGEVIKILPYVIID